MGNSRKDYLSIGDQALLLLDDFSSSQQKKYLKLFLGLDSFIHQSLDILTSSFETKQEKEETSPPESFTVAARLGRTNYEALSQKEEIVNALQRLRKRPEAGSYSSGRIIRSN